MIKYISCSLRKVDLEPRMVLVREKSDVTQGTMAWESGPSLPL